MTADDSWEFNPQLLSPDPYSIVVAYHPHHELGDAISMRFSDPHHGPFVIAFTPETVEHLSRIFATATESPGLRALADQMKAEQRQRR